MGARLAITGRPQERAEHAAREIRTALGAHIESPSRISRPRRKCDGWPLRCCRSTPVAGRVPAWTAARAEAWRCHSRRLGRGSLSPSIPIFFPTVLPELPADPDPAKSQRVIWAMLNMKWFATTHRTCPSASRIGLLRRRRRGVLQNLSPFRDRRVGVASVLLDRRTLKGLIGRATVAWRPSTPVAQQGGAKGLAAVGPAVL